MNATTHTLPSDAHATLHEILARHDGTATNLLPILHDVQDVLGYIPSGAIAEIARAVNLSRAEVHGVVTYYHHFRTEPAGTHIIQICRAEACQSMGAEALLAHAQQHLGCAVHGTTADGSFSLEPAYCLGLCASSPALSINEEVYARMTPEAFDALIAEVRSQV
jgi:formate dehydrogenase subunit gamma